MITLNLKKIFATVTKSPFKTSEISYCSPELGFKRSSCLMSPVQCPHKMCVFVCDRGRTLSAAPSHRVAALQAELASVVVWSGHLKSYSAKAPAEADFGPVVTAAQPFVRRPSTVNLLHSPTTQKTACVYGSGVGVSAAESTMRRRAEREEVLADFFSAGPCTWHRAFWGFLCYPPCKVQHGCRVEEFLHKVSEWVIWHQARDASDQGFHFGWEWKHVSLQW